MAVLFSAVTITSDSDQAEFLVAGIPKSYADLEGWTAFETFMNEVDTEQDIKVHVAACLYGEGEVFTATPEEVAYVAKIVFQKKAYYLGVYDNIEKAAEARKEAEELLFDGATAHYERWKIKADDDPEWAANNPVEIIVSKKSASELNVTFLPFMT